MGFDLVLTLSLVIINIFPFLIHYSYMSKKVYLTPIISWIFMTLIGLNFSGRLDYPNIMGAYWAAGTTLYLFPLIVVMMRRQEQFKKQLEPLPIKKSLMMSFWRKCLLLRRHHAFWLGLFITILFTPVWFGTEHIATRMGFYFTTIIFNVGLVILGLQLEDR